MKALEAIVLSSPTNVEYDHLEDISARLSYIKKVFSQSWRSVPGYNHCCFIDIGRVSDNEDRNKILYKNKIHDIAAFIKKSPSYILHHNKSNFLTFSKNRLITSKALLTLLRQRWGVETPNPEYISNEEENKIVWNSHAAKYRAGTMVHNWDSLCMKALRLMTPDAPVPHRHSASLKRRRDETDTNTPSAPPSQKIRTSLADHSWRAPLKQLYERHIDNYDAQGRYTDALRMLDKASYIAQPDSQVEYLNTEPFTLPANIVETQEILDRRQLLLLKRLDQHVHTSPPTQGDNILERAMIFSRLGLAKHALYGLNLAYDAYCREADACGISDDILSKLRTIRKEQEKYSPQVSNTAEHQLVGDVTKRIVTLRKSNISPSQFLS